MNASRRLKELSVVQQRLCEVLFAGRQPATEAQIHGRWILRFVLIAIICGVIHLCLLAQNAIRAEGGPANGSAAETDSSIPDISGVWSLENKPAFKTYITRAPEGSAYQFQKFRGRTTSSDQITWLPKQKMFETSGESIDPHQKCLLQPLLDQQQIKVYVSQETNIDWPSTLEQLANPETAGEALRKFVTQVRKYDGRYDRLEQGRLILTETAHGFAAYNRQIGRWDNIEVSRPKDNSPRIVHCTVNQHFAVGAINDQLIGYLCGLGRWARKPIPPEFVGTVVPVISENTAYAQVGEKFYTLSPTTGEWTSPDEIVATAETPLKTGVAKTFDGEPSDKPVPRDGVLFFHVGSAGPTSVNVSLVQAMIMDGLPIHTIDLDRFSQLEKTFSIQILPTFVVMSNGREIRRETGRHTREQILTLISAAHTPPISKSVDTSPSIPLSSAEAQGLSQRLANEEQLAADLAEQVRNQVKEVGNEHPKTKSLRAKLGLTLSAALDLKFELEQLQISELDSQLRRLQEQIGQRKAERQKIIDRRVNELIEGAATRWNSPEVTGNASPPSVAATTDGDPSGPKTSRSLRGFSRTANPQLREPQDSTVDTRHLPLQRVDREKRGNNPKPRRISISGPAGTEWNVSFKQGDNTEVRSLPHLLTVPANFQTTVEFANSQGSRIIGTLKVPVSKSETEFFWDEHEVPLTITDDDLKRIDSGKDVTKVVYLNEAGIQDHSKATAEILDSTQFGPGIDPGREAQRRGATLFTIDLAPTRDKTLNSSGTSKVDEVSNVDAAVRLRSARAAVENAKQRLDLSGQAELPALDRQVLNLEYARAARQQNNVLEELKFHLRDLELQIKAQEAETEVLLKKAQQNEKLAKDGTISQRALVEHQLKLDQAKVSMERLVNRREYYKKAAEGLMDASAQEKPAVQVPGGNDGR